MVNRRDLLKLFGLGCLLGISGVVGCKTMTVIDWLEESGIQYSSQDYPSMGILITELVTEKGSFSNLTFEIVDFNGEMEFPLGSGVSAETVNFVPGIQSVVWRSDGEEIIF